MPSDSAAAEKDGRLESSQRMPPAQQGRVNFGPIITRADTDDVRVVVLKRRRADVGKGSLEQGLRGRAEASAQILRLPGEGAAQRAAAAAHRQGDQEQRDNQQRHAPTSAQTAEPLAERPEFIVSRFRNRNRGSLIKGPVSTDIIPPSAPQGGSLCTFPTPLAAAVRCSIRSRLAYVQPESKRETVSFSHSSGSYVPGRGLGAHPGDPGPVNRRCRDAFNRDKFTDLWFSPPEPFRQPPTPCRLASWSKRNIERQSHTESEAAGPNHV